MFTTTSINPKCVSVCTGISQPECTFSYKVKLNVGYCRGGLCSFHHHSLMATVAFEDSLYSGKNIFNPPSLLHTCSNDVTLGVHKDYQ